MADETMRTLISLGSFSPVGGGGGEIPEDLTVCTLTAKTVYVNPDNCAYGSLSVHGSVFAYGPVFYDSEIRPAGSSGSIYGTSGNFDNIYAQTIGVNSGAEGNAGIHFSGAGSNTLTYNCSSQRLEWGGEPVNTTSPIEDLPVTVAPGTFVLKNGKKYQIKADCTSKYPSFNFSNISVEPDATAEIWWKVGTRAINDIQLPSDWKWVGTELDDCIPHHTTLSVAVRKVAGYDGTEGHDVTVANVAYQYTTPAGS